MIWATPAELESLPPNEVHLWRVHLIQAEATVRNCRALLAPDEIARADRFHFDKDRNRYTIARAMLRNVLGRYLKVRPQQVQFVYGPQEKPVLKPGTNPQNF